MQYRKLPKEEEQISILGIGTSSIQASSEKEIEQMVSAVKLTPVLVADIIIAAAPSMWIRWHGCRKSLHILIG